jgi:hypothetical protein
VRRWLCRRRHRDAPLVPGIVGGLRCSICRAPFRDLADAGRVLLRDDHGPDGRRLSTMAQALIASRERAAADAGMAAPHPFAAARWRVLQGGRVLRAGRAS